MAKDAKELWHNKLRSLQDRFEVGARQHAGLRCVLLQVGPEGRSQLKESPRGPQNRIVRRSRAVAYNGNGAKQDPYRQHYFVCDKDAADRFYRLAAEAGKALSAVPPDLVRGVAPVSRRAMSPAQRWIWCVFELGWQHIPVSNLRAFKYVWGYEHAGIKTFPHEKTQLQALVEAFDDPPSFLRSWADEGLPDRFFSELDDVNLAALHAIDTLLNRVPVNVPTRRRPGRHRDNIHLGGCSDWLLDLGWEINDLVRDPRVMARFRAKTCKWMDEHRAELKDQAAWRQRREAHEGWIQVEDRLRNEAAGPPGPGWEIEASIRDDYRATEDGLERICPMVSGWFPPGLEFACEPEPELPLFRSCRVFSLSEKYALFGVIHDRCCKFVEPIDPWWPHSSVAEHGWLDHFKESIGYTVLARIPIPKLDEKEDGRAIEALLADVRYDLRQEGQPRDADATASGTADMSSPVAREPEVVGHPPHGERAKLDDVPVLDKKNGKWITAVAAARTGRALKLKIDEQELSDQEARKATNALKTARTAARAKARSPSGDMGIDDKGRLFRADPDDRKAFWYFESTTDGKPV